MKWKLIVFFSVSVLLLAFTSCEKSNNNPDPEPPVSETVSDLPADTIVGLAPSGQPYGSGNFSFYSLENNSVVESSDSATNKWDLGFRGTTIITNGGTSGPANGGAFLYIGIFNDLTTVPTDSVFKTDNAPSYAIPTGSGNGWYTYNPTTNLVTPTPGRVLVIRTASGKYAKIEILNYYKGGVTPDPSDSDEDKLHKQRYYKFRYVYQPNGSKNFE